MIINKTINIKTKTYVRLLEQKNKLLRESYDKEDYKNPDFDDTINYLIDMKEAKQ